METRGCTTCCYSLLVHMATVSTTIRKMRPWRRPPIIASPATQRAAMGRAAAMAVALLAALVAAAATLPGTASASPAEGVQPLSKIAVHKATVEMQPSAYVRATPSLLGEQVIRGARGVRTYTPRAGALDPYISSVAKLKQTRWGAFLL